MESVGFDRARRITGNYTQHNLLSEMIARGDFELMDPKKLVVPIGHLGARVLMYYLELEEQLHFRRQFDYSMTSYRDIRMLGVREELQPIIQDHPIDKYEEWKQILTTLL